jgi:hypothetical protein
MVGIGFAVGWLPRAAGERATAASQRTTAAGSQVFLPIAYQSFQLPFFDDFSNPASGWPITQTSGGSWGYVNGQYRMQLLLAGGYMWAGDGIYAGDFQAETTAYSDTPTTDQYGIYFARTTGVGGYAFMVNPYPGFGQFVLARHDDAANVWYNIVNWTNTGVVLTGSQVNVLKVTRSGSTITVYANGYQLAQVVDSTLGAGYVDLITQGSAVNSEAFFDNFAFVGNTTTPLPYASRASVNAGRSLQSIGEAGSGSMNPTGSSR